MKRFSGLVLSMALATGAVAEVATNTNSVERSIPQLAANTNTGPEVPMAVEPPAPAGRSGPGLTEATPGAAERRKTVWMVVAVVAVVAGSYVLQRVRSRSDSS